TQLLQTVDGVISNDIINQTKPTIEIPKTNEQNKNNRFISFFHYLFCQCVPNGSNATVTPVNNNHNTNQTKDSTNGIDEIPTTDTTTQVDTHTKVKHSKFRNTFQLEVVDPRFSESESSKN
ncbi:unnamed protein product, partial [Rotaria sp. Silwood1]